MQTQSVSQLFDQAIALAEAMLGCAQNEQWEELQALQTQRDQLLKAISGMEFAHEDVDTANTTIANIRALDAQIGSVVKAVKKACGEQLKQVRQGEKAAKLYQQNT